MSRSIKFFRGTSGLNTKEDPVRISYNYKTGVSDLSACINIDIDNTGRPFRRSGYTSTDRTESWHSLFSCGNYGLGVTGNALAVIEQDSSYTAIRNVHVGARVSYVRTVDGKKDVIFYCNGHEKGRVINRLSYSWPLAGSVGDDSIKELFEAPIGHLLESRNLRLFIAKDNNLYYSEPNAPSLYRLSSNYFGFSGRLSMVQAVSGGLWISDAEAVYFLKGEISPDSMEMPLQIQMTDSNVIEGTALKIPGSVVGEGLQGIVVAFVTNKGVCIGSGDGQLLHITEKKIDLPTGTTGSSYYRDGRYIFTID